MSRSDVAAAGHRAEVLIGLKEPDRVRLLAGVFRIGSRSVLFRFAEADQYEDGDMFGAVIEEIETEPDGRLRARLWFWNDLAAFYVTPGARFEVWYAKFVGEGVVLPPTAGAAEGGADAGARG